MDLMGKDSILYAYGGSSNHGCEALVRSSIGIMHKTFGERDIYLVTDSRDVDRYYMGDICNYTEVKPDKCRLDFLSAYLDYKMHRNSVALDTYPYRSIARRFSGDGLALSIGGDNYCYGYTAYYAELNRLFREAGRMTVLWGCSINEEAFREKGLLEDLKGYSLITARETLTYDLLKSYGLDNVELYPDPAFTMSSDESKVPSLMKEGRWIGVNISPMIQENEKVTGITINNYRRLCSDILGETDYNIVLIPHVVWKQSDDRLPLKQLFDEFSGSGRIIMVEDCNAEQLKGVVSRCRFLITARTHASIAGYSTCVPTLVIGYSVKAKGIAKDIFGTYEDYVLPVQDLKDESDLLERFRWLMEHEREVRNHLESFMPGYIAKAWEAGNALKKV